MRARVGSPATVFVVADPAGRSRVLDPITERWRVLEPAPGLGGTDAMYRPGKILSAGVGTDPLEPTTAVIDLNAPTPSWRRTAPMACPRFLDNLVLLADGAVLAIGGSRDLSLTSRRGVLATEIWDPAPRAGRARRRRPTPACTMRSRCCCPTAAS